MAWRYAGKPHSVSVSLASSRMEAERRGTYALSNLTWILALPCTVRPVLIFATKS
jgi:hypothetical protein